MNISSNANKLKPVPDASHKANLNSLVYGKVPPQAAELEQAVLGAMMLEKNKQVEVLGILPSSDCFYMHAHQRIYEAIRRLSDKRQPVDLLTVTEALRKSGELEQVGGAHYVTKLTMSVISSAHTDAHARIIQEKYLSRELIRISGEVMADAYEDTCDVFEQLDHIENELFKLSAANFKTQYRSASELAAMMRNTIVSRMQTPDKLSGVTTGYRALDRLTNGLAPDTLTIIAARPSVGKTAFAINLMLNGSRACGGAGFFSLEMPTQSVVDRVTSTLSEVPLDRIQRGNLADWEQHKVFEATDALERLNIKIDDAAALNIYELRSKARRMVEEGVGIIFIDYLQLMSAVANRKNATREQEVAMISRDLKSLSKDLHIPVVALSQLSRAVEGRGRESKDPQLSDLRESGSIEQDADMVMFLSRPDYQKGENEIDPMLRDDAYVHVAKSRNGKTDKLAMRYVKDIQRWFDLEEYRKYKDERLFTALGDNPRAGMPIRDFSQPQSAQVWEGDQNTPF